MARSEATLKDMAIRWSPWPCDFAAADLAALDDDAIRGRLALDAQRQQAIGHDLDTVRFLDPQLFGAAQHGAPFGAGRSDEQHREFVDGQRNQLLRESRYP